MNRSKLTRSRPSAQVVVINARTQWPFWHCWMWRSLPPWSLCRSFSVLNASNLRRKQKRWATTLMGTMIAFMCRCKTFWNAVNRFISERTLKLHNTCWTYCGHVTHSPYLNIVLPSLELFCLEEPGWTWGRLVWQQVSPNIQRYLESYYVVRRTCTLIKLELNGLNP